jgi:hypothetical protein
MYQQLHNGTEPVLFSDLNLRQKNSTAARLSIEITINAIGSIKFLPPTMLKVVSMKYLFPFDWDES